MLCELGIRGRFPGSGGVLLPLEVTLPSAGRWLLERDFCEERVVGGEALPTEFRVEEDWFGG